MSRHTKAEIYQDRSGRWRWRVKQTNGQITASSNQSFHSQYAARRAFDDMRRSVLHVERFVCAEGQEPKFVEATPRD